MTFPSSHPIPSRSCHSNGHCTGETQQTYSRHPISLAPRFQDPFRDDLMATAKSFQKLNSFRRLFGFKHVQWNDTLCELAVLRSREFARSKRMRMPFTVGGSKFNLGVPFCDIVMHIAAEYENDKMVPVEKSLWKAWSLHQGYAQHLLEPLANFAAVSVVKNKKTICFTMLMSKLPPFFFLPVMRRRPIEKEGAKGVEKWDRIIQEIGLLKHSLHAFDGEEADDEADDDKDGANERKDDEVVTNENDGTLANNGTDDYANNRIDEASWEDGEEESKIKTNSLQRVIYEVPLIQPPNQSFSQFPAIILDFAEDGNVESIFEECTSTASVNQQT